MSWSSYFLFLLGLIFGGLQHFCVKCDTKTSRHEINDIIVNFVNGTYIDEDTFELTVNYNDDSPNSMKIRVDIIKELPPVVYMKLKVWGRAFGQYKLPTGISLDLNMCDATMKKYVIEKAMKSMGPNASDCPPKPGRYEVENYEGNSGALLSFANLKGLQILIEFEMYSPPPLNISILQLEDYLHL